MSDFNFLDWYSNLYFAFKFGARSCVKKRRDLMREQGFFFFFAHFQKECEQETSGQITKFSSFYTMPINQTGITCALWIIWLVVLQNSIITCGQRCSGDFPLVLHCWMNAQKHCLWQIKTVCLLVSSAVDESQGWWGDPALLWCFGVL